MPHYCFKENTKKLVECSFAEVVAAANEKMKNVKAFKSRKTLPINIFADFLAGKNQEAEDIELGDTQFDCFLGHEWGTSADGNATHQKVKRIGEALHQRGLKVWLDENHLRGEVAHGIMNGLNKSVLLYSSPRGLSNAVKTRITIVRRNSKLL